MAKGRELSVSDDCEQFKMLYDSMDLPTGQVVRPQQILAGIALNKFVFIPKPSKELMKELKAGSEVHLRALHYGSNVNEHVFSLNVIDEVNSRCDVLYQSDSYSLLNREITQLKKERDMEIRRIEREYSRKIAAIRAMYN